MGLPEKEGFPKGKVCLKNNGRTLPKCGEKKWTVGFMKPEYPQ